MTGVNLKIPFDDALSAMYKGNNWLPEELGKTALGGIAIIPTGKSLKEKVFCKTNN